MATLNRVLRYILLYGFRRTLVKVLYKLDRTFSLPILRFIMSAPKSNDRVGIIGLGNHGFTLIAFFVCVYGRKRISFVIDPSSKSKRLAESVLCCKHFKSVEEAVSAGEFYGSVIYIASDHMSHTKHALQATDSFTKVYIEKPLFVDRSQAQLFSKVLDTNSEIYTGFNRPLAPFTSLLENELGDTFSVSIVVNGHYLPSNHWYREDGQGSRILGNLTHWLDLSVRFLALDELPVSVNISAVKGVLDDISVTLSTGKKKIDLLFSANCEPSNGVEEFIFWNSSISVGRIVNFQTISFIRENRNIVSIKNRAKNVGHSNAVLAPLHNLPGDARLAYLSSVLALRVEEMYLAGVSSDTFEFNF